MSKLDSFVAEIETAKQVLARRDPKMRALIKRYGDCGIRPHTRYFETLIGSIISQQLSTKAAATIHRRFLDLYKPARFPKLEQILATPNEHLRAVGMSNGKASFVKDLVEKTQAGHVKFQRLAQKSDDEIIEMLTQVKGIGVWTVHMFLIFSLGRLDVLPVGDLGVRRGIQILYGFDELPNADQIEQVAAANKWRPYCSVASWYLWRSLENKNEK